MNTIAKEIQTSKDFEQLTTQPKTTRTTGRAESLANRIEEGAAGLAAFAEGLSEEEWRTPVSERDGRSVGVIVHHVASVYPIEIDLARIIASGTTLLKGFIGPSLLLLMAIGVTHQNGAVEPKLSVSESSFAGRFALGLRVPNLGAHRGV